MYRLETLLLGIVDSEGTLEGTRLERQRGHEVRVMGIMVRIYPSLRAGLAVGREYKNDILGP
jgi:hypothetical protein